MSLSPLTFTGVSTYSTDFQTILTRAGNIAALPIQALQNQQKDLLQQKLLVTNLNSAVDSMATSLSNLGKMSTAKALTATSSNSAKVAATSVNADNAATYTITNITSIAKAAAETSVNGYAVSGTDTVSATGVVDLVVGATTYHLDITADNTLAGLRDAINQKHAGVTATVLTTGTGTTPNYLSVTANAAGKTTLQLIDDPGGTATQMLTSNNQGADTEFLLNGVAVKKQSSYINDVVSGVTFDILGTTSGSESVNVTVAADKSQITNGLRSFVSAYNTLRTQLNDQIGESAGLLTGDFLVREVQTRLRATTSYYEASGSVHSLTDMGIAFDSSGEASLDEKTVNGLSATQLTDAFQFLGSSTSGLGAFAKSFTNISDSVMGLGKIQLDNYESTNKRLSSQIAVLTERATAMQASLAAQLHAADSLLGSLQSQQNILTATIQSLNYSTYGKSES